MRQVDSWECWDTAVCEWIVKNAYMIGKSGQLFGGIAARCVNIANLWTNDAVESISMTNTWGAGIDMSSRSRKLKTIHFAEYRFSISSSIRYGLTDFLDFWTSFEIEITRCCRYQGSQMKACFHSSCVTYRQDIDSWKYCFIKNIQGE